MRRNFWIGLVLILALIGIAGFVAWPTTTKFLGRPVAVRQGLDLQGGVRLVYQLDLSKTAKADVQSAIDSTVQVMNNRVNSTGASEPVITPGKTLKGENIITVELPGIKDVQSAIDLIGKTAQLDFREQDSRDATKFIPTGLSGKQLSKATVTFDQNTNAPQISLQFNSDGAKLFGDITTRNIGKPVGIFLDDQELSAPTVQAAITSGQAVITGQFTIAQVRQLTTLLNAGALDVPLKQTSQQTVGATLGAESVKKSLVAGVIGLGLVMLFMIFNYQLAGLVAVLALVSYTVITFALFKWIPVTLTLAGIAGFILSIGMAVDANILIFERMREELRSGRELKMAMEEGFRRAWPSVRDSNASTLITSGILYATTTGLVRGFALTLAIGVLVSLFSSITISRTFLRLFSRGVVFQKWLAKV